MHCSAVCCTAVSCSGSTAGMEFDNKTLFSCFDVRTHTYLDICACIAVCRNPTGRWQYVVNGKDSLQNGDSMNILLKNAAFQYCICVVVLSLRYCHADKSQCTASRQHGYGSFHVVPGNQEVFSLSFFMLHPFLYSQRAMYHGGGRLSSIPWCGRCPQA